MLERKLTPRELNLLFCCPEFLRRVEESGKSPADVYIEASEDEVAKWLAEGARMERRIHSAVPDSSEHHRKYRFRVSVYAPGKLLSGFLGLLVAVVVLGLCAVLTPFRYAVSPGTQWYFRGQIYDWPAIVFLFIAIAGIPGFIGGAIISLVSKSRRSTAIGYGGIALGVLYVVWDMIENFGGGLFAAIIVLLTPAIFGIGLCMLSNRIYDR